MLKLSPRLQSSSSPFTGPTHQKQTKLRLFSAKQTRCDPLWSSCTLLASRWRPPLWWYQQHLCSKSCVTKTKRSSRPASSRLAGTAGVDRRYGHRGDGEQSGTRGWSRVWRVHCSSGLCRVSGWDVGQAAGYHRRVRQHLHLWIRWRQIQTQHEQRRMPAVRHQWYRFYLTHHA